MADFEITIIGAGVVGLAIAERLSVRHSHLLILEKNERYGMETSSRNSEVIHAGIYYKPGSLKARLCTEGRDLLYDLCKQYNITHRKITKLITATTENEVEQLERIASNAEQNGVHLKFLTKEETLKLEPNIRTFGALFSPLTGIVSVHHLMDFFAHSAQEHGAILHCRCEVLAIEYTGTMYNITVNDNGTITTLTSDIVINAAGLQSDIVAAMVGIDVDSAGYRLTYAKGSYFVVVPSKAKLITRLVYPVPQNEGLGVHALVDWGGRLKFGPDVEYLPDRTLNYAVDETKRHYFAESIRRILPSITDDDIEPDMSGIRPKLQRKGEPPKDFVIIHERERGLPGFVNLIGIESPGLTSSPAIARYVEQLLFG
ncbi:MAG: NAD(P)/FAD-dependent oxidoreductase [Bacteroidetes bacterium]|nr:NAD(P)/FAD-dependent oxidoreductase [Bacteroidota bacterium]